jgi:hypothetical protein
VWRWIEEKKRSYKQGCRTVITNCLHKEHVGLLSAIETMIIYLDYPPIFAARGRRASGVVHVAGAAVPAAARGVGVEEGGGIVPHVAGRP